LSRDEITKYFEDRTCLDFGVRFVVEHLLEDGVGNIEGKQSVIEGLPITGVKTFLRASKSSDE
jgi:predicted house-cleaning NTP pyrophosphatase (Maf/HAM1 superfamily)